MLSSTKMAQCETSNVMSNVEGKFIEVELISKRKIHPRRGHEDPEGE
jgi:hypothetical protein